MIPRQKFRTKEARKRARIRAGVRLGLLSLGVVGIVALFGYVCHLKQLRISDIYVDTNGGLENDMLASAIQNELKGSILGIIPRDSVFLGHTKDLEEDLSKAFPRIANVSVRRAGFSKLSAEIQERSPVGLWCGDVVPPIAYEAPSGETGVSEELWGTCYLIDASGFIYAPSPIYSGNVFPRYYGSLEEADPLAQQYMPEDQFSKWQAFYIRLGEGPLKPQALLFVDERDTELYLENGLRILMPREEDPDAIYEKLSTLLDSGNIEKGRSVEYVDLRFGNKVYVKYLDNTVQDTTEPVL